MAKSSRFPKRRWTRRRYELNTRQLAVILLQAKGLDANDHIMRRNVAYNIVQIMGNRLKRGSVASNGKQNGVRMWRLP